MNPGKPSPQTPQLTIVISTLNAVRTLVRCLCSIEKQSFRNFEVIIIDGGSTDGTAAISAQYGHVVAHFQSEPDTGIYDAWNKALRIARGQWICFLGADDWFTTPNALSKFAAAAADPAITLISARVAMTNSEGTLVRTRGMAWEAGTMKKYMCIAHPGAWHHRSLFDTLGRFRPEYRLAGDYEFLLRSVPLICAAFIPESLVTMELGGVSNRSYWLHVRESYSALKRSTPGGRFHAMRFVLRASLGRVLRKLKLRSGDEH